MAFLGKDYKFEKQENFDGFLRAAGLPEDEVAKYLEYKPTYRLELDGDTYTSTSTTGNSVRKTRFKPGVELEDMIQDKFPIKTTYTVDGNVIIQLIKSDLGSATFKREYIGDELVVTITGSNFDGVAKRWYRAQS